MKKKTKSSSTYFVKERFFSDIINIFEKISNTPEQYKKSEVLNTFMNRLTSYHKRILVLYFNHILSQSKNIWFFQQFEDNGQDLNIRVSLLDLKIVIGQKVYGNDMFHKLEKFMSELPRSIYTYCAALFSKTNITGLPLTEIKKLISTYDLNYYTTELDDLSIVNFSIMEDKEDKYKGIVEQFSINKYPFILCNTNSDVLYWFKKNNAISTNLKDEIFLSKLDSIFKEDIYLLGTEIDGIFNLIYLSRHQLHIISNQIKGFKLNIMEFVQEDLDKLSLCIEYEIIEFRVIRNVNQALSACYKAASGRVLMLRTNILEEYKPIKYLRKVKYLGMDDSGVLSFQDRMNKNILEFGFNDIIKTEDGLLNIEAHELVQDMNYFILYRNYGYIYIFKNDKINKGNCGYKKLPKIIKGKYDVFK